MDYDEYLANLIAENRFGAGDRLGTANLIDASARLRAVGAVHTGECLSLARPLVDEDLGADVHAFVLEVSVGEGPIGFTMDRVELSCHGMSNTHLDALNHMAIDGMFYGSREMGDPQLSSIAELAAHGLVTRGVVVDVPSIRGQEWVTPEDPVTGDDIDRALGSTTFERGDALLLYMGRDRFEAAGSPTGALRPGVGRSGAEWMADNGVSIVCWDFIDVIDGPQPGLYVHRLIRAIGLLLVDNCDLAGAAGLARDRGVQTGALVVSPIAIPGGTGCHVTPLLML